MSNYREHDDKPNFKENVGRRFELLMDIGEWEAGSVNGINFPEAFGKDDIVWAFSITNNIATVSTGRFRWIEPPLTTHTASDVSHPHYYGGEDNVYEAIKVINAHDLNFCLGNAIKYVLRAGKKESDTKKQDLQKAVQYLQFEIEKG
jgi:hypothetical protein